MIPIRKVELLLPKSSQRTHHEICAKQGPNNEFLPKGVKGIGEPIDRRRLRVLVCIGRA